MHLYSVVFDFSFIMSHGYGKLRQRLLREKQKGIQDKYLKWKRSLLAE